MPSVLRLTILLAVVTVVCASPAESMPPARQNALVQKYCTVCHTDASRNGGLSLEHFDAAQAAPSLTAMLLSKITGGASLETARNFAAGGTAAEIVNQKMKGGAMGAAGIPIPDHATIAALIEALAAESAGAESWSVRRTPGSVEASILREVSSGGGAGRMYRLIVSCDPAAKRGSIQAAWSPQPQNGTFDALVDGAPAVPYTVKGSESMGNRSGVVTNGLAALMLTDAAAAMRLPADNLTIRNLFPGETVVFPFASLPPNARRELEACLPAAEKSAH